MTHPCFGMGSSGLGGLSAYPQLVGGQNGNWAAGAQIHSNSINAANQANMGAIQTQALYGTKHISQGYTAHNTITIENAGVKAGEIIGWRMWNVRGEWLEAYSAGHIWAPEENMEGKVPDNGYEGIWSFKEKRMAMKKMLESAPTAFGSIKMWGKVVEHEIGYRAEFAKIISIDGLHLGRESIFSMEKKKLLKVLNENYKLEKIA